MTLTAPQPRLAILSLALPGPDRKRTQSLYHYRVSYRNPDPTQPGCSMTWQVSGGREPYQIALERMTDGARRWHCTCADAVYRGENKPGYACKHVQGLKETLEAVMSAA